MPSVGGGGRWEISYRGLKWLKQLAGKGHGKPLGLIERIGLKAANQETGRKLIGKQYVPNCMRRTLK
jgi:hypothetical protein